MILVARAPVVPNNSLAVVKFWHGLAGLYFWEFITTLGYEWKVVRGHLPYRWTIWVYSLARLSTLLSFVLVIVSLGAQTIVGCKVIPILHFIFSYLAFSSASLLLLLRMYAPSTHPNYCMAIFTEYVLIPADSVAIWDHKKAVVRMAICLWVTSVAFLLQGIIRVRFVWLPDKRVCAPNDLSGFKIALIVTLVIDILLLVIVLVGLLRSRRDGGGGFGIQGFLWKQGIVWLMLASLSEAPAVALIILDLNSDINLQLHFPSLAIMSITATRMHRSLVEFSSGPIEITSETTRHDARPISKIKQPTPIQITLDEAVRMHSTDERHLGSQSSDRDSRIGMDGQLCNSGSRSGLATGRELESDMEESIQ